MLNDSKNCNEMKKDRLMRREAMFEDAFYYIQPVASTKYAVLPYSNINFLFFLINCA